MADIADFITAIASPTEMPEKMKCNALGCNMRLPGGVHIACAYCHALFCAKHRLVEDHACPSASVMRVMKRKELETRLLSEASKPIKRINK